VRVYIIVIVTVELIWWRDKFTVFASRRWFLRLNLVTSTQHKITITYFAFLCSVYDCEIFFSTFHSSVWRVINSRHSGHNKNDYMSLRPRNSTYMYARWDLFVVRLKGAVCNRWIYINNRLSYHYQRKFIEKFINVKRFKMSISCRYSKIVIVLSPPLGVASLYVNVSSTTV